jgi:hypothetical protein
MSDRTLFSIRVDVQKVRCDVAPESGRANVVEKSEETCATPRLQPRSSYMGRKLQ